MYISYQFIAYSIHVYSIHVTMYSILILLTDIRIEIQFFNFCKKNLFFHANIILYQKRFVSKTQF